MRERLVLEIPEPSLVVLVGAAGSGKSTFAARHFVPDEVLSSDAFRGVISGNPADQAATRPAFAALHRALERRLAAGRLTVVDATSVKRQARASLLRRATAARVPSIAIVFDLPAALVGNRNRGRSSGVVPDGAVERQLVELAASLGPGGLDDEGFAAVHRLTDAGVIDVVEVRRRPA
jgi:predicted kinase